MSTTVLNYAGVVACVVVLLTTFKASADVDASQDDPVAAVGETQEAVVEETAAFVEEVKDGLASADLSVGAVVYEDNCAACHGYDGVNLLPEAPDFTQVESFEKKNTELFRIVRDGRGDIMPPWSEELSVAEMFAALAFAKQFAPENEDGTAAVEE